ncbi:MAG: hypothetical protein IK079_00715 [Desulfovibrio sp.]|nr:hypothetical protein [Desulfovibrio sp.]
MRFFAIFVAACINPPGKKQQFCASLRFLLPPASIRPEKSNNFALFCNFCCRDHRFTRKKATILHFFAIFVAAIPGSPGKKQQFCAFLRFLLPPASIHPEKSNNFALFCDFCCRDHQFTREKTTI